jgi:integrase
VADRRPGWSSQGHGVGRKIAIATNRRHFGNVRRLPSKRWQASYWHNGARHPAPHTFLAKADAQAWLSAIETDIKRGAWTDPAGAKITVAEWLQHWLAAVVDGRVGSDNTRSNYAQIVRVHITPALGQVPLVALTAEMVDQFLAVKAEAGLARTHVSRMRTVLADALRHAERRGLVVRNVAALAVMPRTKAPTARRSFTPNEVEALLAAARGERLEAMVIVGLAAGLRPGELTGLLWSDVDLNGTPATLTVSGAMKQGPDGRVSRGDVKRSKNGRRTIALPPRAVKALRSHRSRQLSERLATGSQWAEQDLVMCSKVGTPLNPSNVRRTFARIAKRAGLDDADFPYLLRHSAVSLLLDAGASIEEVADLLGDDPRTLYRHYRHKVRPVADLATRMESILAGVDPQASRT